MPKKQQPEYWFKVKKYGWGWGLPLNFKGWLSFLLFVAIWLIALLTLLVPVGTEQPSSGAISLFVAIIVVDVAALVYISFKYGEPPRWKWGGKDVRTKTTKSKSD